MTAIIKEKIKVFTANQFLNVLNLAHDKYWGVAMPVTSGDIVINANRRYIAMSSGTTGSTAPTHTSGTVSDGGVDWLYIEQSRDDDYYQNNLYGFIGRPQEWSPDDTVPDTPKNSDVNELSILSDAIFFKRFTVSDITLAIQKYVWTSGTVYDEYDDTIEDFNYTNPFYVINSEPQKNIYKCLDNNGGSPSIAEPTGQSVNSITTSDGYVWKYMGSVDASDAQTFQTNDFIPVRKKLTDDGSVQWQVQQNATSGSVNSVSVVNGGSNYTTTPTVIVVPATGDSPTTPMTATATLNAGSISEITITDNGAGYTKPPMIKIVPDASEINDHQPTIEVSTVGSNGEIQSISITNAGQYIDAIDSTDISITSASGSGAVLEPVLDDNMVLTGFTITNAGTGYAVGDDITITHNNASHDCILSVSMQPKNGHGANILEELDAKYVIINMKLELDEGGMLPYYSDPPTNTTPLAFRQIGIVVDPIIAGTGEIATGVHYKGNKHPSFTGNGNDEIKSGSGGLLFIENTVKVERNENQTEDIKFILRF